MADLGGGEQKWAAMCNNGQQWTMIRGATCISDAVKLRVSEMSLWSQEF